MTLQGQARPAGGERAPAWSRCSNMSLCQIDGTTHDSSTTPHRKTTTRTTTPPDPAPRPTKAMSPTAVRTGRKRHFTANRHPASDRTAGRGEEGSSGGDGPDGEGKRAHRQVRGRVSRTGPTGARVGRMWRRWVGRPGRRAGRARRTRGRARSGVRVGVPAEWWSNEFAAHRRPGRGGGSQSGGGPWSGGPAEW
jgi:hypothetical protein